MTRTTIMAAALALAVTLAAMPAQAGAPRTFVSAAGTDNSKCSFAKPCRHFQAAVNATSAGGEVDALNPADYGPITITQAITIEGQGWSYIAPPAGGNGITINAVSGNVAIHGVSINGAGITAPTNGIVFNSGGSLTVTNCTLQNFVVNGGLNTGNGIVMQPTAGTLAFTITNTTASNNGNAGIYYLPQSGAPNAKGVIDHVVADANQEGIAVDPAFATGGSVVVTVADSIVSNNSEQGIVASGASGTLKVSIDNVTISGNGSEGIVASSAVNVLLGRSVITGNGIGVHNITEPTNTFYTYKDNRINLNGTDISGPLNMTFTSQ